jgi:hypothetical protein
VQRRRSISFGKVTFVAARAAYPTRAARFTLCCAQPIGSFVIRPSAFAGCLAISHVEDDGTLGHGVIHLRTGAEGRYGYSIENSKKTFETLPIMLSVLPGLRLSMYGASYDAPRRAPGQK